VLGLAREPGGSDKGQLGADADERHHHHTAPPEEEGDPAAGAPTPLGREQKKGRSTQGVGGRGEEAV